MVGRRIVWGGSIVIGISALAIALGTASRTIDVRESAGRGEGIEARSKAAAVDAYMEQNGYLAQARPARVAPAAAQIVADPASPGVAPPSNPAEDEVDARLRIYRARVELLVADVGEAIAQFLAQIEADGGYLESRTDGAVTCRIPAAKFRERLDATKALGQVLKLTESVEDVTAQRRELAIRIENAEKSRARLLELLARAQEVTAILEIERELRRLTEEIETLTASARGIDSRVAFSTLEVVFWPNAPEASQPVTRAPLFPWIDRIGIEPLIATMLRTDPRKGGFLARVFSRELAAPKGFVITEGSNRADVRALAPDRSAYQARTFETASDGDSAFWLATFRSDFVERRGYVVLAERAVKIDGSTGTEFTIERTVRGRPLRYLAAIAVKDGRYSDEIRVIEYLAERSAFEGNLDAVRRTAAILAED